MQKIHILFFVTILLNSLLFADSGKKVLKPTAGDATSDRSSIRTTFFRNSIQENSRRDTGNDHRSRFCFKSAGV